MQPALKIKDYKDGKLIKLTSFGRANPLRAFYGLFFLIIVCLITPGLKNLWERSIMTGIICSVVVIASALASFRFFAMAFVAEKLFVNKERLEIIHAGPLSKKGGSYSLAEISDFRFDYGDPPPRVWVQGEDLDYFGFQGDKNIIEDSSQEGLASFVYRGRRIRFGKELTSWEFEELEALLRKSPIFGGSHPPE